MNNYLVATIKDWQIAAYHAKSQQLAGNWHLISDPKQLTLPMLRELNPRYIFFPHWSWLVPEEILNEFECICFHMTDVPYGRGGSPLQNLIARGHKHTQLTALRMEKTLDTGPVYLKVPLSLEGTAQQIFELSAQLTFDMIESIVKLNPEPYPQQGQVEIFQRRTPEQSQLPTQASASQIYDHIRMLDAQSYPHAFVNHGNLSIEFTNASIVDDKQVTASVTITINETEK